MLKRQTAREGYSCRSKHTKVKKEIDNLRMSKEGINLQVREVIEKIEDVWKCKLYGKHAASKPSIVYHAKTHIEGISLPCDICDKIFPNKQTLRQHISGIHSELFSCDVCGKSGMKKANYYLHKRNKHQILSRDMFY